MNRPKSEKSAIQINKSRFPISKGETIGAVATLSFLIWTAVYPNQVHQRLIHTGHKTVAVVTQTGLKNATVAFWASGRKHIKVIPSPHSSIQNGEKYELFYNPKVIDEATVLFEHPVFDKHEYATTSATYVNTFWLNSLIKFSYTVGKKNYDRYQKERSDKPIDGTQPVHVAYKITDPNIAYLEY